MKKYRSIINFKKLYINGSYYELWNSFMHTLYSNRLNQKEIDGKFTGNYKV